MISVLVDLNSTDETGRNIALLEDADGRVNVSDLVRILDPGNLVGEAVVDQVDPNGLIYLNIVPGSLIDAD